MLIQSIKLNNILSFGSMEEAVPLGNLNVVIGPNGSGKSNLLECFELLRNAPEQIQKPIREGGGITEWIWKGSKEKSNASIDINVKGNTKEKDLYYWLTFAELDQRFKISDESILSSNIGAKYYHDAMLYSFNKGKPNIKLNGKIKSILKTTIDPEKSILAQLRDPVQHPEITWLGQEFAKIRLYREWTIGKNNLLRTSQRTDLPNDFLESDGSNLGLVLNYFQRFPKAKKALLDSLKALYDGINDYILKIEGGTVQVFLQEGNNLIPASRLSDGTLRYLYLLAILHHPKPPPLVCIEEPELGLHPDILPTLAELLKEASKRCQVIVTTHSDILVDAMTDQPESIVVCEKGENGSTLKRLNAEELKPWLEKYRLGELWTRGEIGGNRW